MSVPDRIGNYPIERELGRGGMGIVYLGRDTRLDRLVAIKVLPDAFAHDAERLARFEREARMLASLTHPNVAGIYGVEESAGHRFLVLEYVEGETLAERLARGPLPVDETIEAGRQIAAALEAAHESGIVHRDLKPGNVKLTPAGEIKVLDFGLARGGGAAPASDPGLSASPTMAVSAMTSAGVILGTAAYMSPEQARGRAVDRRTDIWSFGCVLYECLTARQAFGGETVSDMIASILQGEPDWKALPANVPQHLRALMERCLTKDPKKRLRDIGEARLLLEGGSASLVSSAVPLSASAPARVAWLPWSIAAAGVIAATGFAALWAARTPAPAPVRRVSIAAPPNPFPARDAVYLAISPDGTRIVTCGADSAGGIYVWLRPLDGLEGRQLPGTEDGTLPFWSPDGRYIGFSTQDKLKKLDLRGGSPEILCPIASYGRGASWSPRGVIVFSGGAEGPIYKVSKDGGTPAAVTTLDSAETGHRFPRFLPDGRHFLYSAMPPRENQFTIYVGSIDSPERERLMVADGTPVYADPGYLLFGRNGRVVAQRFDAGSRRLIGEPTSLADEPHHTDFLGSPSVAGGSHGVLAYYQNLPVVTRLVWVDREGRVVAPVPVAPSTFRSAVLSPDGRRAVADRATSASSSDLWLLDLERGAMSRLTHGPGRVDRATWSPDGTRIAFSSDRNGRWDIFEKTVDGTGPETPLVTSGSLIKYPSSYSADGRTLVFEQLGERTGWDLWTLPLDGNRTPRPLLVTPYDEQNASLARDGRWLAYSSNESGRPEVYVQDFPRGASRHSITAIGGNNPRWRSDGREIVFLSGTNVGYVVVNPEAGFTTGAPRMRPLRNDIVSGDPAADLSKVLVVERTGTPNGTDDITLVFNWRTELKQH